jgi:dTDP-4-dehydrorhamnose 3,5-epimerase
MRFRETELAGAYVVELELREDARGFFARTFCSREFRELGLSEKFVQCSVSFNHKKGTVRGMHFQRAPSREVKLVRCTAGAIYDVIVDMRPESASYLKHVGVELTSRNRQALYIPGMVAHGFQTLEDNTEVFYQIDEFYAPETATGVRYDDPKLGIKWKLPVSVISEKDREWELL